MESKSLKEQKEMEKIKKDRTEAWLERNYWLDLVQSENTIKNYKEIINERKNKWFTDLSFEKKMYEKAKGARQCFTCRKSLRNCDTAGLNAS